MVSNKKVWIHYYEKKGSFYYIDENGIPGRGRFTPFPYFLCIIYIPLRCFLDKTEKYLRGFFYKSPAHFMEFCRAPVTALGVICNPDEMIEQGDHPKGRLFWIADRHKPVLQMNEYFFGMKILRSTEPRDQFRLYRSLRFSDKPPPYGFFNIPAEKSELIFDDLVDLTNNSTTRPELNVCAYDIEIFSFSDTKRTFAKDPTTEIISVLSVSLGTLDIKGKVKNYKNLCLMLGPRKETKVRVPCGDYFFDLVFFRKEKNLLKKFLEILKEERVFFLTGWNIVNFDNLCLKARLKHHGIATPDFYFKHFSNRKWGSTEVGCSVIGPGIITLDMYIHCKMSSGILKLDSFKLNSVAKKFGLGNKIGTAKDFMKETKTYHEWFSGRSANYEEYLPKVLDIAVYCTNDSILVLKIEQHLKFFDFYLDLCKMAGINMMDGLEGNVSIVPIGFNSYKAGQLGYPIPESFYVNNTSAMGDGITMAKGNVSFKGGVVLRPVIGVHKNVAITDAESLYPNVQIANKICFSGTFSVPKTTPDEKIDYYLQNGFSVDRDALEDYYVLTFQNIFLVFMEIQKFLLSRRKESKTKMKTVEDPIEYNQLNNKQNADKIVCNMNYGITASRYNPFHNDALAASTTSRGRETLRSCERFMKEKGYEVIYGDTDSNFVKFSHSVTPDFCEALFEEFNATQPACINFKLELIFDLFIIYQKKKYMGITKSGHLKLTGVPHINSEIRAHLDNYLKKILILLKESEPDFDYIEKVTEEMYVDYIVTNIQNVEKVTVSKNVKELDAYSRDTTAPHVRYLKELKRGKKDVDTTIATKLEYVEVLKDICSASNKHLTYVPPAEFIEYGLVAEPKSVFKGAQSTISDLWRGVDETRTRNEISRIYDTFFVAHPETAREKDIIFNYIICRNTDYNPKIPPLFHKQCFPATSEDDTVDRKTEKNRHEFFESSTPKKDLKLLRKVSRDSRLKQQLLNFNPHLENHRLTLLDVFKNRLYHFKMNQPLCLKEKILSLLDKKVESVRYARVNSVSNLKVVKVSMKGAILPTFLKKIETKNWRSFNTFLKSLWKTDIQNVAPPVVLTAIRDQKTNRVLLKDSNSVLVTPSKKKLQEVAIRLIGETDLLILGGILLLTRNIIDAARNMDPLDSDERTLFVTKTGTFLFENKNFIGFEDCVEKNLVRITKM